MKTSSTTPVIVPQIAAGGGWTTEIILLNPADDPITGIVRFLSPDGNDQSLTVDGMTGSTVVYSIPAGSSRKLSATGDSSTLIGSFVVTPDKGKVVASVATVYVYASNGVTLSTTGAAAGPSSTEFSIYSQLEGTIGAIGSIQMGVALANGGNEPAEVSYELVRLDGVSSGVSGKLIIPANGQKVSFVRELAGAEELAVPFKGVLRLSSSTPIAALAIRGRYNERGEFLLSTTPPADTALSAEN